MPLDQQRIFESIAPGDRVEFAFSEGQPEVQMVKRITRSTQTIELADGRTCTLKQVIRILYADGWVWTRGEDQ